MAVRCSSGSKAGGGDLAGNLGDPDRAAELIGAFPSGENPADIGQGAVDDEPGLLCRPHDGRSGPTCSVLTSPGAIERLMPSTPAGAVAEAVLALLERGRRLQRHRRAAAIDLELSGAPALALTMRCMSEKLSIVRPSIESTTSPA